MADAGVLDSSTYTPPWMPAPAPIGSGAPAAPAGAPGPTREKAAAAPAAPQQPVEPPSTLDIVRNTNKHIEDRERENERQNREFEDASRALFAQQQKTQQEIQGKIDATKPPPEFKPIPYKKPKPTSIAEAWGSSAMIFSLLASLFVRQHSTASLNAAAAVMNGFKQNDEKAVKESLEEWKIANENVQKAAEYQQKAYDDLIKKYGLESKSVNELNARQRAELNAEWNATNRSFSNQTNIAIHERDGLLAAIRDQDMAKLRAVKLQKITEQRPRKRSRKPTTSQQASC